MPKCSTPGCRQEALPDQTLFGQPLEFCQFCLLLLVNALSEPAYWNERLEISPQRQTRRSHAG